MSNLSEPSAARTDSLARLLDAHEWVEGDDFCNCGHYVGARMPSVHKWHLAEVLATHVAACVGCGHEPHAVGLCESQQHPACDCNEDAA